LYENGIYKDKIKCTFFITKIIVGVVGQKMGMPFGRNISKSLFKFCVVCKSIDYVIFYFRAAAWSLHAALRCSKEF